MTYKKNYYKTGLSSQEAERRLKRYGLNEIQRKESMSPIKIFFAQFNDFITWILIAATVISGLMGEKADAITIFVIIIMNAVMGFIQEYKTEKSLEALRAMAAPTAKVIRDEVIKVINAENLVIGDIVLFESGDRVSADCILIECSNFMVDESLLTGESASVNKSEDAKENSIFMGTIVLTGRGTAKVSQTGMATEMGKIANMLQSIEDERSPLKEKLASMGKVLVMICIAICIIVTVLGIMRGNEPVEMFLLGVSLAVAAIPEGLGAIVTIALALGVSRMLKRKALVRRLPAVETLGCTSIICSDKTGTLTENKMKVKAFLIDGNIYGEKEGNLRQGSQLKKIFTYCNDSCVNLKEKNIENALKGDPTEQALVKAYFKSGEEVEKFISGARRVSEIPFDSDRKMMSVVIRNENKEICYTKGAPEMLIERCSHVLIRDEIRPLTQTIKTGIMRAVDSMSKDALRCIGGAYKELTGGKYSKLEQDLVFVGAAGIIDPPRPEVKDAVLRCKVAGIRPVMITGDHKNTAFAIGRELDICNNISEVITGDELERMNDRELISKIDRYYIFARVNPKHKLRIVKAFKNKNRIVAMTGDGVNDAPAVKEADIGISMGISGTDVTKEASAMILLDDNFATIIDAVEEGRVIYDNIRKFIRYLLSCNLGEVLTMFIASLVGLEVPLLAIQILFVNLVTDGLPAIALGVDPADKDVMLQKPRQKNESIFARGLTEKIMLRGGLIGICTVTSFIAGKYFGFGLECSRTLALSTLILSQLIHVFECRSENYSVFQINILSNPYLIGAVSISVCMLMGVIYIPFMQSIFHTVSLNIEQWGIVVFFSFIIFIINSLYLMRKR